MKKSIVIGKNISIELTKELLNNYNKILNRYKVSLDYLFMEGSIKLIYSDDYIVKNCFGDISFYDSKGNLILSYVENFGKLEFRNSLFDTVLEIPIYE